MVQVWNTADPDRRREFVTNVIGSGDPYWSWNHPDEHSVATCLDDNGAALARLLAEPGARSAALADVLDQRKPR